MLQELGLIVWMPLGLCDNMKARFIFDAQRGFSLVELSIVLTIVAVLLGMAYSVLPQRVGADMRQQTQERIKLAETALQGFAVEHYRLPCPDLNGNGLEQCVGTGVGGLPWKSMGLTSQLVGGSKSPLRYGVYTNPAANLTVASNTFIPSLPVTNASGVVVAAPVNINGFDFCRNVRNAAVQASVFNAAFLNTAGNRNLAYVLADAGNSDANGDGSLWDGLNTVLGIAFDDANRMTDRNYDDVVNGASFYRLMTDMGCEDLGRVHALATSSIASVDTYSLWSLMVEARVNEVGNAQFGVAMAITGVAMATFDVALAGASLAMAIVDAADTFGVAAFTIAVASVALAAAIAALVSAAIGLANANASLASANAAVSITTAAALAAKIQGDVSVVDAIAADAGGIRR